MAPTVLFLSPYSLLDSTNGAAISMRMLLETLGHHGFECHALTGTFSPSRDGLGHPQDLSQQFARYDIRPLRTANLEGFRTHSFRWNGLHVRTFTLTPDADSQLYLQELALSAILPAVVRKTKPDLLLASIRVQALDRIAGVAGSTRIPLAAYVATAKRLTAPQALREVKHVLVPSSFLADYYFKNYKVRCEPLRPIIRLPAATGSRRRAQFVTMVNPSPEKGVTLFAALARRALKFLPGARFQIVEGRWTRERLKQNDIDVELPNITFEPNAVDLRRVFQQTSVLIHPSYCEEAFGRTIAEAQGFGVPVLASRRGGSAEALNGGGFLFDISDRLASNFRATPSTKDLQPWLDQLTLLLTHPEAHADASRAARRAARRTATANAERAISLFSSIAR